MSSYKVHKFGGTSLADATRLKNVVSIVKDHHDQRSVAVVSAMGGITDKLVAVSREAVANKEKASSDFATIVEGFRETARQLLNKDNLNAYFPSLEKEEKNVANLIDSISVVGTCSPENHDYIIGLGEVFTAELIHYLCNESGLTCGWIDARKVITLDEQGNVDYQTSQKLLLHELADHDGSVAFVTGFVAKTAQGAITTLGRNGSDYSASLVGNFLDAKDIIIWTDVDGVMSGDPRKVPEAQVIAEMTYQEATELAYFGANVIHLKTMLPALQKSIPIWIKNSMNPGAPGTKICARLEHHQKSRVTGFTTIGELALLNVEGRGMIGVPGIAARLFSAMNTNNISVVLISQASSEFSICFAIHQKDSERARKCAEQEFQHEISRGMIEKVEVEDDCCILAAVGDDMVGTVGISAKLFSALGKAGVNIRAIAQGSSERNISVVIKGHDATKALRSAHSAFYLSDQTISVGVIGPGVVGGTLLDQLKAEIPLLKKHHVDLRVRGITNSRQMLLDEKGLSLDTWRDDLESKSSQSNLAVFVDNIQTDSIPHTVIVDCTTSEEIAGRYVDWLEKGIHIITPNKKAPTFSMAGYHALKEQGRKVSSHLLYETTVGAGLPIIGTLKELIQTGDEILQIEGVLSGTLAYLFYQFDGTRPFSEIVREAKDKGFTEPDPRDDLSGMDIVRKVVILSREIGMEIETSDVPVESLVPKELEKVSIEEFLEGLKKYDDEFAKKIVEANKNKKVLRYVGLINPQGKCEVKLESYDETHPFSRIKATDNIVAFRTRRYNEQPLIVQGPGAGPDVTAGGVFAEILRLSRYLGSTL